MIQNIKEFMQHIYEDRVIDLNNPSCNSCNECCDINVIITTEEYRFYKKYFKKEGRELFEQCKIRHIEKAKRLNCINLMCPFSSKNKRCLIYNIRPEVCRKFHCKNTLNKLDKGYYSSREHYTLFKLFCEI